MSDFELAAEGMADPLDMGGLAPPPSVPRGMPGQAPRQPQGGTDKRALMKLAMLIPMAMKAGPGAMQGLLAGFQQSQQQAQTQGIAQGRYDDQQAQQQAQQTSLDSYRNQQIEQQNAARQQALLKQFGDAVGSLDDPNAVKALVDLYGGQAEAIGLDRPSLERYAQTMAAPTTLQKRAAEKRINALKAQHGDKWMENGAKFLHDVSGERVPFDVLMQRAGYTADPNAKPAAATSQIDPQIPLDRQHAMAVAAGNEPLAKLIEQAMGRQDATKRDPPRQPIQITVGGSGLTKAQIDSAAGLRDDYRTESKDFTAARDGFERVLASAQDPSPAGDMALLYGYMKLLDPNSVVRETEFATAAKTGSLPQQIQASALRLVNGERLTAQQRADFVSRARSLFGRTQARQNSRKKRYEGLATQFGVPTALVLADDDAAYEETPAPPPAAPVGGAGLQMSDENPYLKGRK